MSSNLQNSNSDNCGNIITFRAIHSYKGNVSKCQLSFQKGDIIVCNAAHVSENDPASGGWLWGCIENSGCIPSSTSRPAAVGWFPPKYVQRLSSPVSSISPPESAAAAAEVDDPFAGLPLLSSISTVGNTYTSDIAETVREERTPEEKSITSPDIAYETIIPASDETHSFQFTDGDDRDEFGDFDGGIQPEITIESEAVLDEKAATKGLPSPETFADFEVETNSIVIEAQNDSPSLPFAAETAVVTANSDRDTDISAIRSDELNFIVPSDLPSESKLSHSQERCFDPENDHRVRQEQTPTTVPDDNDFIHGTFDTTTANSLSKFDKNTTLEGTGKNSPLELPSPEKLGILINRLDIESFNKGIIPDIPYLENDEAFENEPAIMLTEGGLSLKDDETTETDSNGKPPSSAINHNFIRIDSSISKLESFHSVRESIGTVAEDSSREVNDTELGKLEEDNPIDTSPPVQFFDAAEDEEEFYGTGQSKEPHSDEEIKCIANGNSHQMTFMDSKSVGEGQQYDEDEFGDFNGNVSPAKQQLSLAASDDFGSFDGGFLSSPTSGYLNDGISVSNCNKSFDFPVVLDGMSLPPLSEYRSSDVEDHNPESTCIFLGNKWKADQNVVVDNGVSDENYRAQSDVESCAVEGIFVSSEAPSWQQERIEDIVFHESIDENFSSKSCNEIPVKDVASLHVPFSSEALGMTQIQSIFSGSTDNTERSLSGEISVNKRNGENANDSSPAPLELPSPEKLISVVESRKASKQVPEGDSEDNEDLKGINFGIFIDGDEKAVDWRERGQVIGKTSISSAFVLPSPDKLGIYSEASGANNVNSLHLPFSAVSKDDTESKLDNVQPVNDANGDNMNSNTNEQIDDASDNGTSSINNQDYHFQSPEELDLFIETTATGLKDKLSENFLLSQIDAGQKSNVGDKSASGYDLDDAFGDFSDGLALASTNAEYAEIRGAQIFNSLQLPFSVVPNDDAESKHDDVQPSTDANGDNMKNNKKEQVDGASDNGTDSINNQAYHLQSPEELDLFIETTAAGFKDTLSEKKSLSQIDAGQKSDLGNTSASCNDSDDGFGEFSDGLALASPGVECVETAGAQVSPSQLPFSAVPDGSLGKFDELRSVNGTNGDNMNNNTNERVDDADSTRSRTKNNQICFQSPEQLDLFIESTAARLKDTLSENVSLSQIDVGQKSDLGDKSASGSDSDDGFGEFSDGLALVSPSTEHDSTTVRSNTLSSGGVSEDSRHLFNYHDDRNIEQLQRPSSTDVIAGGCMKKLEEQPEDLGHCIENFSEANLFNGDAIHPVGAKEALEANVDFLPSKSPTAIDNIEFSAFPETATWIDDAHTNYIDTSPTQSCALPHIQFESEELHKDLKVAGLEILKSSAEIQASSNQRLDEVTQEFDEFGDFGGASLQQLKSDACTFQPEMDDAEFGDFADFDEPKKNMPQGETVPHPDTKSNFDESDFGDFSGDFPETQEIPDGSVLNAQDQEWIIAAQEVMESIFPMPDFTFSYPTEDYRPPSLSDILELDSDPDGSRPDPTTLWSERSLQQCFQKINQRSDTPSRIICVPVAPRSSFPIVEEQETKGYKELEESLSLEPAYTF